MAYDFTAASSQYLSATASPLGTGQLGDHTIAMWVNGAAVTPNTKLFNISRSTESSGINNPTVLFQNANGQIRYFVRGNSSPTGEPYIDVVPASSVFNSTNQHIAGSLSGTTARVYINGSQAASTTVGSILTQTGMDRLGIGALVRGNVQGHYSGQVAEVGIWNVALTAAEIASLAKGFACSSVRPQSLVFYAPLIRNLQDLKAGVTITNNNTATVAAHPRVYA